MEDVGWFCPLSPIMVLTKTTAVKKKFFARPSASASSFTELFALPVLPSELLLLLSAAAV
eukprot:CAMPEP_0197193760 /NCGR_PEP_ID=MMETSP1423-20130617/27937_1 /TAXON_ID=476441 /ORGANISM="Pseudo-nitzschia heimii, Strain UNC1101" /LENGTH=59 /DNA_ID=CAMNT_0042647045 /DNA_START=40 /DNA_END=219 /DNA_ORIENTATION=-